MGTVSLDPVSVAGQALGAFKGAAFGVDSEGVIRYASEGAVRMSGREMGDLLGIPVELVLGAAGLPAATDQTERHPVRACLRGGEERMAVDGTIWLEGGGKQVVKYGVAPVWQGEQILGAVVGIDVVDTSLSTADLMNTRKLESLGRIAAGVAHEINTPTQYVNDNVHFLEETFHLLLDALRAGTRVVERARLNLPVEGAIVALGEQTDKAVIDDLQREVPEALEQTLDGLGRITRIAGALKEFLHPGGSEKRAADLNRAVENAVAVCRNEWRYVADVKLDLDSELPAIPCWVDEVGQVVLNLVTNAAHSIADRVRDTPGSMGVIAISTRRVDEWAEIEVRDSGAGIPAHLLDAVFDPFFTTKDAGRGTGQGLALARSVVVDRHGGTIDVESQVGQGATFTMRLPLGRGRVNQGNSRDPLDEDA